MTILFGVARKDPTKIGKAVQIAQNLWIGLPSRGHATLSPAAAHARDREQRRAGGLGLYRITSAMAKLLAQLWADPEPM